MQFMKFQFAAGAVMAVSAFSFLATAATKIDLTDPKYRVTKKEVLSVSVDWIKDKGNKYDLYLNLKNEADFPVIVKQHDLACGRGDRTSVLKHATISSAFNIGEKTIDMRAGEMKSFTMVCPKLGETDDGKGPYEVTVQRIYTNRSGDGKTSGDILAKDVMWKYTPPKN